MAESKRKRISYKVATFLKDLGDEGQSLETLLKKAVKKIDLALDRIHKPQGDTEAESRFINYTGAHTDADKKTAIYGTEFLAFEHGADQSTIKLLKNKKEVDLDAIGAGTDQEFLAGSVYIGVYVNHVVMMASASLRSKELEDYLNWFLIQKAKVLGDDNGILLRDHMPEEKKRVFTAKGVRGITLSAPVKFTPEAEVGTATGRKTKEDGEATKKFKVKAAGAAWEAIKAFLGASLNLPSSVNLQNLADTPDIEVSLSVKWKGRHDEDDVSMLDGLATNLRHVEDEVEYSVDTPSGRISKDDFKHFDHVQVEWATGRPKLDHLFPKMAEWLASLIRNGTIDP